MKIFALCKDQIGSRSLFKKKWMIMRLAAFLLLVATLQANANATAQKITITASDIPLEKVLIKIKKQSGYAFFWKDQLVSSAPRVSVQLKDASLTEALDACFRNLPFSYKIENNFVYIFKKETFNTPVNTPVPESVSALSTIHGIVTNSQGQPLAQVSVTVKGTGKGTTTDAAGAYSISVEKGDVLQFSFIGYKTTEVVVGNKQEINVSLSIDVADLGDVVVVGYGSKRKSDLTGAMGVIKTDSLGEGVMTSVEQILQGKVSGVNILQNDGKPGGGFSINIRGASSINASNAPLYVVDGVPLSEASTIVGSGLTGLAAPRAISRSPLASINPTDIESISVLKGPSAVAIYGSRGANGVVLITTKRGSSGKIKVNYNAYIGIQNSSNHLKLLNAAQYKDVLNALLDAGADVQDFRVRNDQNISTDWQREVMNKNALVYNNQLSFSGGTGSTNYFLSFGYINQDGIIVNSGYKRYSARLNLNSKVSEKFKLGLNLTTSYAKNNFATQGAGINENADALYAAYNYDPTIPVKDSSGGFARSPFVTIDNPVALATGVLSSSNANTILGSFSANYSFSKSIFWEATVAGNFVDERRKSFATELSQLGERNNGLGSFHNRQATDYLFSSTLNYNKSIEDKHTINAFIGASFQHFFVEDQNIFSSNFPTTVLQADNLGLGDQATYQLGTSKVGHRLASLMGRVNYSLLSKYLFTGSIRFDGSSRFGENNRVAAFPSFAFGWKLNQEKFLEKADFLDELKLRAEWGETGNEGIGNYLSIPSFQQGQIAIWNNLPVTTTVPSRIANPDLKWETTIETNIGIDFSLFKSRISGSVDYFYKDTRDMLLDLPVPQSTGFNVMTTNIGSMKNTGVEITLNTENLKSRNFKWSTSINFSTIKNKVKSLGPIPSISVGGGYFATGDPAVIVVGQPLNSFYGYQIDGIWQQNDNFSATKDKVQPGDLKFRDINGDSIVNSLDRTIISNSFPDFMGSITNTFSFGNFEILVSVSGVYGMSMLNLNLVDSYYPINFRRNKYAEPYLNRWTPDNPSNKYPSFVNQFGQGAKYINNYVVEDASYLKLNTVRLSYKFHNFKKLISNMTVYVTGQNLATLTKYQGLDPAINPQGDAAYRIDFNTYPTPRTFILGIMVGF